MHCHPMYTFFLAAITRLYFPVSKSVQVSKPTSVLVSSKLQVAIEHSTSLVVLALKMAVWYSGLSHRRSFFTLSCAQLVVYWDGWPTPTRQTVSVFNQPPLLRWKMSSSQNAMLLCGWKVKVGWLRGRSHTSGVRGVRTPCQEIHFWYVISQCYSVIGVRSIIQAV